MGLESAFLALKINQKVVYLAKGENVTGAGAQGGPKQRMEVKPGRDKYFVNSIRSLASVTRKHWLSHVCNLCRKQKI